MNLDECAANLTGCLASIGLQFCDAGQDVCLERGICITSIDPSPLRVCICYPCYYGETCEKEAFSRNLWILGSRSQTPQMIEASKVILLIFTAIQIINCALCLQTYISSKKIRLTNLGVYLIFNAIVSCLIALEELVLTALLWFLSQLSSNYWQIECMIDQKFVLISLTYMWGWSVLAIGVERMLVEYYQYSIFSPRRRSLIVSTLIFIICPLTTIPGIFTLKTLPPEAMQPQTARLLIPFGCINYTPVGYTINRVIGSLHAYGTLVSYAALCLFVFYLMLKHRRRISE